MSIGFDTSGLARLVDQWTVDEILVTRNDGTGDDTLDPETGALKDADAPVTVYDDLGAVLPLDTTGADPDPDTAQAIEDGASYRLMLRATVTTDFHVGDRVRVKAQHTKVQDPTLPSRRFKVQGLGRASSYIAGRFLFLEELDRDLTDDPEEPAVP